MKKNNITIMDVAQAAQVSKTTVSRFLNGKYEFMSEETQNRIRSVIEQLDYHPSKIARNMKSTRTRTIGCAIADITNPISSILVKGINDICAQKGYSVLFSNTNNSAENEIKCIRLFLENEVDGIIVNTAGGNDDYLIEISKQIPVVLADRIILNQHQIDAVTTNNFEITYQCMEFLYKQGYKKVAFISEEFEHISSRFVRYQSYLKAMKDYWGVDGTQYTYFIDPTDTSCEKAIRHFAAERSNGPIALFAVNGVVLMKVLHAMDATGNLMSGELGVCGFDDWDWASLVGPGITTIKQNSYAVGTKATSILIRRIESEKRYTPRCIELKNEIIIRGSTTPTI